MELTAHDIHTALAVIDDEGWDGPVGRQLLELVRRRIVMPSVRRSGLRGPAADQAAASCWAAAWDALRRASARSADNPAGMAWVAVRRAVAAESAAGRRVAGELVVDLGWDRLAGSERAAQDADAEAVCGDRERPGGQAEPTPDTHLGSAQPSPLLDPILEALRAAGWEHAALTELIDELADAALGASRGGWRMAATRVGCPPWRASRLWSLLVGRPGRPGLLELVAVHGLDLLEDPGVVTAIRATSRQWLPSPAGVLSEVSARWESSIPLAGSPCPEVIWTFSELPLTVRAPIRCDPERSRIEGLDATGEGGRMRSRAHASSRSESTETAPLVGSGSRLTPAC